MNNRERTMAAIRHKVTDRIPADAICVETVTELSAYLGIRADEVLDRLGLHGRVIAAPYIGPALAPQEYGVISDWGSDAVWDYGTTHRYPLADVTCARDVEMWRWPSPLDFDYQWAANIARDWDPQYAVRGPYWLPVFSRVCSLFGIEDALTRMVCDTEVFEAAVEVVTNLNVGYCERLLDACGDHMPILCLGDDFATQRGLMMSPEMWRRLLKPAYARMFAIGHARGKAVWFHSCGDITSVIPDLLEIGMEVWETVQLQALPMSAHDLKREFGTDLTFFGGISTQRLPFTTPDCVRDEVRRVIEALGSGGGYICGPDHHIKADSPPANTWALFDEIAKFRQEGYTCGGP